MKLKEKKSLLPLLIDEELKRWKCSTFDLISRLFFSLLCRRCFVYSFVNISIEIEWKMFLVWWWNSLVNDESVFPHLCSNDQTTKKNFQIWNDINWIWSREGRRWRDEELCQCESFAWRKLAKTNWMKEFSDSMKIFSNVWRRCSIWKMNWNEDFSWRWMKKCLTVFIFWSWSLKSFWRRKVDPKRKFLSRSFCNLDISLRWSNSSNSERRRKTSGSFECLDKCSSHISVGWSWRRFSLFKLCFWCDQQRLERTFSSSNWNRWDLCWGSSLSNRFFPAWSSDEDCSSLFNDIVTRTVNGKMIILQLEWDISLPSRTSISSLHTERNTEQISSPFHCWREIRISFFHPHSLRMISPFKSNIVEEMFRSAHSSRDSPSLLSSLSQWKWKWNCLENESFCSDICSRSRRN